MAAIFDVLDSDWSPVAGTSSRLQVEFLFRSEKVGDVSSRRDRPLRVHRQVHKVEVGLVRSLTGRDGSDVLAFGPVVPGPHQLRRGCDRR